MQSVEYKIYPLLNTHSVIILNENLRKNGSENKCQ